MKYAVLVARVLLGAGFVVFGLNMFLHFLPQPPPVEGSYVAQYMAVMIPSNYMSLVALFQIVGGAMVLYGGTAPLGLAMLAPILVNILAFHLFLEGGAGIAPGVVFSALAGFLVYAYRAHFRGLFTARAQPTL